MKFLEDYAEDRQKERLDMVEKQIRARGIVEEDVLQAFRDIPRHLFIPEKYSDQAYRDRPVPIGEDQTISQPFIVAEMTRMLRISPGQKVLEIGTGSGYQASVLNYLGAKVYTVERISALARNASRVLKRLGCNVKVVKGDGTTGLSKFAPYDRIIVTAAAPETPRPLMAQLAPGGKLVIPVGSRMSQILKLYERYEDTVRDYDSCGCIFVPLIGKYGWEK